MDTAAATITTLLRFLITLLIALLLGALARATAHDPWGTDHVR
jgi:hypothetical protein